MIRVSCWAILYKLPERHPNVCLKYELLESE